DCTFATLTHGATATVTVTYHVAAATPAGSVSNTGSASSPDTTRRASDTKSVTVTSDVALQVTKAFSPSSIVAGSGDHTFTVKVKNTGAFSTAHNVVVTDLVPATLAVAS